MAANPQPSAASAVGDIDWGSTNRGYFLDRKTAVDGSIAELRAAIAHAKRCFSAGEGGVSLADLRRAEQELVSRARISQRIQARLSELKETVRIERSAADLRIAAWHRTFVKAARSQLPKETYQQLVSIADGLVSPPEVV